MKTFIAGLILVSMPLMAQSLPPELEYARLTVTGRNLSTQTKIDVYKCDGRNIASCMKFNEHPLPIATAIPLPANAYYRLSVNAKIQEAAMYLRANESQVIDLPFLTLSRPSGTGDYRVKLALDMQNQSQREFIGLQRMDWLNSKAYHPAVKNGPAQNLLDFCHSRQMYMPQADAPGRLFTFQFSPEAISMCQAIANDDVGQVFDLFFGGESNGMYTYRIYGGLHVTENYSDPLKQVFLLKWSGPEVYQVASQDLLYGEGAGARAKGWNVLPGIYYLHWEDQFGNKSIQRVEVP